MSMSLGPLKIDLDLEPLDKVQGQEILDNLREEAQKLTQGSDARILLHMISGYLAGRLGEE